MCGFDGEEGGKKKKEGLPIFPRLHRVCRKILSILAEVDSARQELRRPPLSALPSLRAARPHLCLAESIRQMFEMKHKSRLIHQVIASSGSNRSKKKMLKFPWKKRGETATTGCFAISCTLKTMRRPTPDCSRSLRPSYSILLQLLQVLAVTNRLCPHK